MCKCPRKQVSYCASGQQLNTSKHLWGIIQGYHGLNKAWVQKKPGTLIGEPTRTNN